MFNFPLGKIEVMWNVVSSLTTAQLLVLNFSIPSATLYFSQNGSTWWSPVGGPVFGLSSSHMSPTREEQRQEGVAGQDMGACTPLPQPLGSLLQVPSLALS